MNQKRKKMRDGMLAFVITSVAHNRLEEFRNFTFHIENKFRDDKKKIDDAYKKAIRGLNDDRKNELAEFYGEDYWIIEDTYIGMYRNSTLVTIYSFIEHSLNKLSLHLYNRNRLPIRQEDLRGEVIW